MVDTLQQGESHGVELLLMWNGRHPGLVKLELEALAEIYDSRAGLAGSTHRSLSPYLSDALIPTQVSGCHSKRPASSGQEDSCEHHS